jgi:hypothetical protein
LNVEDEDARAVAAAPPAGGTLRGLVGQSQPRVEVAGGRSVELRKHGAHVGGEVGGLGDHSLLPVSAYHTCRTAWANSCAPFSMPFASAQARHDPHSSRKAGTVRNSSAVILMTSWLAFIKTNTKGGEGE